LTTKRNQKPKTIKKIGVINRENGEMGEIDLNENKTLYNFSVGKNIDENCSRGKQMPIIKIKEKTLNDRKDFNKNENKIHKVNLKGIKKKNKIPNCKFTKIDNHYAYSNKTTISSKFEDYKKLNSQNDKNEKKEEFASCGIYNRKNRIKMNHNYYESNHCTCENNLFNGTANEIKKNDSAFEKISGGFKENKLIKTINNQKSKFHNKIKFDDKKSIFKKKKKSNSISLSPDNNVKIRSTQIKPYNINSHKVEKKVLSNGNQRKSENNQTRLNITFNWSKYKQKQSKRKIVNIKWNEESKASARRNNYYCFSSSNNKGNKFFI
jgi:hypothetical protein